MEVIITNVHEHFAGWDQDKCLLNKSAPFIDVLITNVYEHFAG